MRHTENYECNACQILIDSANFCCEGQVRLGYNRQVRLLGAEKRHKLIQNSAMSMNDFQQSNSRTKVSKKKNEEAPRKPNCNANKKKKIRSGAKIG